MRHQEIITRHHPFMGPRPVKLGGCDAVAEIFAKIGSTFRISQKIKSLGAIGADQALCPPIYLVRECTTTATP